MKTDQVCVAGHVFVISQCWLLTTMKPVGEPKKAQTPAVPRSLKDSLHRVVRSDNGDSYAMQQAYAFVHVNENASPDAVEQLQGRR